MDKEDLGDLPIMSLSPPSQTCCPPQKFPETIERNNIFLLLSNGLLLQIPLTSQPPRETLKYFFKKSSDQYKKCDTDINLSF